jgi:TonB family protein
LAQYIGTLKQALEALWAKPTGLPTQAQAQVSFTLSASGTLLIFKIIHSSGHPAFDASVTQVFQAARALPPPPSGQACSFVLTFKATDT